MPVSASLAACRTAAVDSLAGCDFVEPAGGFYITLRIPHDEETSAMKLLSESHILVHPGYFYDIDPNHLVMTFIDDPASIRDAFGKVAKVCRV